jgi:hypothetical protein
VTDRKQRFDVVNKLVTAGNGWVTSVPGAPEVVIECLPGSALPAELRELGYDVVADDLPETTRILPAGITEILVKTSSGAYVAATPGSTAPVELRHHAGLTRVERWRFTVP